MPCYFPFSVACSLMYCSISVGCADEITSGWSKIRIGSFDMREPPCQVLKYHSPNQSKRDFFQSQNSPNLLICGAQGVASNECTKGKESVKFLKKRLNCLEIYDFKLSFHQKKALVIHIRLVSASQLEALACVVMCDSNMPERNVAATITTGLEIGTAFRFGNLR